MGIFFISYNDAIYLLNHSSLDQMPQVMKCWEGVYYYYENIRLSGDNDRCYGEIQMALKQCGRWIHEALEETDYSTSLPRSTKQSLALQNNIHPDSEVLDMGLTSRSDELRRIVEGVLVLRTYWHDRVNNLPIKDRLKLEIAALFNICFPLQTLTSTHSLERPAT